MNEIIERIMNRTDKRIIEGYCKRILKKFSFNSARSLQELTELALWLYVFGFYEEALSVCDIVKDCPFTGNYDLWDNIDYALCIKSRILREQGKTDQSREIISYVNKFRHPELYANILPWFTVTLDENIQSNFQSGCKTAARKWRVIKLSCAVAYREGGDFPLTENELEKIIGGLIEILKTEG
ncbi:MAG: hypothetical protein NC078_02905 [Ruminococcus sp.]|nr:hypothetical protein [Ruminococcus sp.]